MLKQSGSPAVRWTIAGVYTLLIYTFAWLVLPMWFALTRAMGTEAGGNFVNAIVPVLGVILLLYLFARRRFPTIYAYFWIGAIICGYGFLLTLHADYPVERIH